MVILIKFKTSASLSGLIKHQQTCWIPGCLWDCARWPAARKAFFFEYAPPRFRDFLKTSRLAELMDARGIAHLLNSSFPRSCGCGQTGGRQLPATRATRSVQPDTSVQLWPAANRLERTAAYGQCSQSVPAGHKQDLQPVACRGCDGIWNPSSFYERSLCKHRCPTNEWWSGFALA